MERTVELIDVVERQLIVDERAGEDVEVVLEEIEVYDAVVLRPANLSE